MRTQDESKDCNIKQVKDKTQNKKDIKRSFKHIDQIQRW